MHTKQEAQSSLLKWYSQNGRFSLPWRQSSDIYHIYISEIMLQQTQVSRVQEHYYPLFLERYPTIKDLANCQLDDLLATWSGLGYYSRARNLHKAAQICAKEGFPNSPKEFMKLPGIGKYTASAICSFALNQNISVVDTNIARVLKRLFAMSDPKDTIIWEYADSFLNHQNPKEHNLALMDLGSLICTPKEPKCKECPLEPFCKGKENPTLYTQSKKVKYESLELFLGLFIKGGKLALVKSKERLYHSLLTLPHTDPIEENFIGKFKHSYTKYRIDVNLYKIEECSEEIIWYELSEIENAPVSSLTKKALQFL